MNEAAGGKIRVRPLGDRVLVRPHEADAVSPGGVLIPAAARDKFPALGDVLAVGPGRTLGDGRRAPTPLRPGVTVVYGRYQGTDVEVGGEMLKFLRADDVLAALETPGGDADGVSGLAVLDVRGCARCGLDHAAMPFTPLANPADEWDWWGTCPATGQPVLMRFTSEATGAAAGEAE